jgi:hypothetical protein
MECCDCLSIATVVNGRCECSHHVASIPFFPPRQHGVSQREEGGGKETKEGGEKIYDPQKAWARTSQCSIVSKKQQALSWLQG